MKKLNRDHFWEKVQKSNGCWLWMGKRSGNGYGQIEVAPHHKTMPTHRFAWVLVNGPIPDGMHVCHRCDNPPCVRPDHLFLGTVRDNSLDMVAKGRNSNGIQRGSSNGYAKLNEEIVIKIRQRHAEGASYRMIAVETGVSIDNIGCVVRRERWTHV